VFDEVLAWSSEWFVGLSMPTDDWSLGSRAAGPVITGRWL